VGPTPTLPEPSTSVIPLVNVVDAKGWPDGASPSAVPGTTVGAFARGLSHPRWLYVLPNGDVLVAETNAPKRPDDNKGIKGWFFKHYQKKAGGAVPSANRITLLRDADGDGVADTRTVFSPISTRRSAWRSSATPSTWRTPMRSCDSRIRLG
jgi:glucose/arabinose dehydrogenase